MVKSYASKLCHRHVITQALRLTYHVTRKVAKNIRLSLHVGEALGRRPSILCTYAPRGICIFTAHTVLKRYLSSWWLLSRVLLLKQPCNESCDKIQQYDLEALPQNRACTIENKVYFLKQPLSFQLLNKMQQAKPCNFMAPLLCRYELCQRIANQYHCCPEGSQQIISLKASFSGLIHLCIGSCLKLNIQWNLL